MHPQEWLILWSDWTEAESALDVDLCHLGASAQPHDSVHGTIHCDVFQGKLLDGDAVIDATSFREGQVHNQAVRLSPVPVVLAVALGLPPGGAVCS